MRRTANDSVLARRSAARRRYFGAHAFLLEIFKLLGDPDAGERHVPTAVRILTSGSCCAGFRPGVNGGESD